MRLRSTSVLGTLSWDKVLDALEVPLPPPNLSGNYLSLPARTACPICREERFGIHNSKPDGPWCYCYGCRLSGDLVEVAAKTWKVERIVAARRLLTRFPDCGAPADDVVTDYYTSSRCAPAARRRMTRFFSKASDYLIKTQSQLLNHLVRKFRFHSTLSEQRWRDGPGQMLGAYPCRKIESVFSPRTQTKGGHRIFVGGKWTEALVIPYHDLPGRICGFQFIGRAGASHDRPYKRSAHVLSGRQGGFACHRATYEAQQGFGNYIVATPDPYLAVRLQIRQYAVANLPVPLIAYNDSFDMTQAWEAVGHKTPVFWDWRLTATTLHQAMKTNGYISLSNISNVTSDQIDHFVRDNPPQDLTRKLIRRAKPWRKFLAKWCTEVSEGTIESLLLGMERYDVDMADLLTVSPRLRKFERLLDRPRETVVAPGVVERDGQWWLKPKQTLMMNARLRIDATVLKNGEPYYVGRLVHKQTWINFELPVAALTSNPVLELSRVLAAVKPGAVLYIAVGYSKRVISAALHRASADDSE